MQTYVKVAYSTKHYGVGSKDDKKTFSYKSFTDLLILVFVCRSLRLTLGILGKSTVKSAYLTYQSMIIIWFVIYKNIEFFLTKLTWRLIFIYQQEDRLGPEQQQACLQAFCGREKNPWGHSLCEGYTNISYLKIETWKKQLKHVLSKILRVHGSLCPTPKD